MIKKIKRNSLLLLQTIFVVVILISINGCSNESKQTDSDKLNVVATTTMLGDLATTIGGDKVEVNNLMPSGVDPHLYQASAGDVKKMQDADVVIYNGLHLEGKMGDVFDSLSNQDKNVIVAQDGVSNSMLLADEQNPKIHDPHIWFDVKIWIDVAKHVEKGLAKADPSNADYFKKNLEKYLKELNDLDQYIINRVNELDKNQRVLITAHDAFRYFGKAYGFEVKGLQGISTDAQASTGDVNNLAAFISNNKIKAIFIESSVPPKNVEALQASVKAKGFNVDIGGELYSDSLGDEKSGHDSYIKTFKTNIDTVVDALK